MVGEVGIGVVDIVIGVVISIPRSKPGAPGSPNSAVVVRNQGAEAMIEDVFLVKVEVERVFPFGTAPHAQGVEIVVALNVESARAMP